MAYATSRTDWVPYNQGVQNDDGSITQTERLFTVRPRSMDFPGGDGDRGTRAYIRLMTTDKNASLNRSTDSEEGIGVPQTLSGPGSPLQQAVDYDNTKYGGYASFILTDIRCSLDEKIQITEVFGDAEVVYYFGRQPIIMNLSGLLVDSVDNDWFTQWMEMYGHVMRGTQLARNYELVKLVLPNMTLVGTIPHMSWAQNSGRDTDISFEFQFQVKQLIPTPVQSMGQPMSAEVAVIDFNVAADFMSQAGINSIKSSTQNYFNTIQDPFSSTADIASSLVGLGSGLSASVASYFNSTNNGSTSSLTGISGDSSDSTTNASPQTNIMDMFNSVSSSLAGVRASLFSPIYGVMSSLTKLVKNVLGDATSIFNSIANPVKDILRDVRNISNQATGIVNLITNTINNFTGQVTGIDNSLRTTLASLKNTAGVISSSPKTIFQSLQELVNSGRLPATASFLQNKPLASLSSGSNSTSKLALLNSGARYTPTSAAYL